MLTTRANGRRSLVEAFAEIPEADLTALVDRWESGETQAALRAMVERLSAKKTS
jgi:hypothetical protein